MMYKIPKYEEGQQYSDEVKNSVRYGYLYRKEAERNLSVHACIVDAPDILLWLANVIICGFAWDVIKAAVKKVYRRLKKNGTHIDEKTKLIMKDEAYLYNFIVCIQEFNERSMSVDNKQLIYIKEEIEADYIGKKLGEIMGQEKRKVTTQEIMEVYQEARNISDSIL